MGFSSASLGSSVERTPFSVHGLKCGFNDPLFYSAKNEIQWFYYAFKKLSETRLLKQTVTCLGGKPEALNPGKLSTRGGRALETEALLPSFPPPPHDVS